MNPRLTLTPLLLALMLPAHASPGHEPAHTAEPSHDEEPAPAKAAVHETTPAPVNAHGEAPTAPAEEARETAPADALAHAPATEPRTTARAPAPAADPDFADAHAAAASHGADSSSADVHAASDAHGHAPAAHIEKTKPQKLLPEERASLLRIADSKLASGDTASALIAYRQVASAVADTPEAAPALLGMARVYRVAGDGVKAAATYEHLISNYPDFPEIPTALLESGRTLRDLGTPRLAIARFYSVIHSTLKLPEADAERYRRIVRTAQFEIAETHLSIGNYPEAIRFFNRLDLLDLAPADRSRARFKSAQSRILAGEKNAAVGALTAFISSDPDAPDSPEARHLLATLLAELGRKDESIRVTLGLLQHEHTQGDTTDRWRLWQRRSGNQLANQFYQGGEFTSALLLYRALDKLDPAPEWRVPVLYQVALCQERLEQPAAAITTYEELKKVAGTEPTPGVGEIVRMAAWRAQQISWINNTSQQITSLRPGT